MSVETKMYRHHVETHIRQVVTIIIGNERTIILWHL